jgi:serine/threonine protein kinase
VSEPLTDTAAPRLVAGRYEVGAVIGRGGRAIVYEARDPLLQRDVAIKLFHADAVEPGSVRVQEAEARLLAGMNHYALTTLFDAGVDTTDPGRPMIYLVMERIPGVDLRLRLREDGPLTPAQVAYLGFDLAEGLQYVHEYGFLHRDIKPANVLLAERRIDSRIRGKLTDFGIATLIGLERRGEQSTGTVAYLSPEQVDQQSPTPASDVYALGLVLLEALTGVVAFPGKVEQSAYARLERDPHVPDWVPAPLATLLRSMTALLPEDRPGLEEVAIAFQSASVQDLVSAGLLDPQQLATDEERRLAAVRRYNILDTPPDDAFDRITDLACRLLGVPVALISIVDVDREWIKSRRGIEITQVGTLCVFDHRVRSFTDEELNDLSKLAAIAMRELDLRLASRRALFDG